ncbi:muts2 family protein [Heliomicrobium modesticaldum Ice1]|uniref:Endonuclease MutS2 n=1 Tax=Heliobacterium modesticaldum (strain ATCC 51547 / Ice1) TaxID=498761 RepID=B0TEW8_HELMI|nr:muts2 family protein [Heliomicrobium modesticaldum Ice1]
MELNERTLRKLEYDRILERLAQHCVSEMGREMALSLRPKGKLWQVQEGLSETTEAKEVLRLRPNVPLAAFHDIRPHLRKTAVGGILEAAELQQVAAALRISRQVRAFLLGDEKKGDDKKSTPILTALAEGLGVYREAETEIDRCIVGEGEVADDASPELLKIRRTMKTIQNRVREKLDALIRNPDTQKYLQDALVTVRGDRYVVPVRSEYRSQIPGLIHDQSASGATVFIEPMAVVELNNELKRNQAAERTEIIRILRDLSLLVAKDAEDIGVSLEVLARLDFIFAKGKLSARMDAGEPAVNTQGKLKIRQGRHPLIAGKVVPVTIELGHAFDTLVITGPNTGGKTVTLKTVGLLTLMAQSGLHVPAEADTELSLFEHIFVDIGDEQSIEQSLSTFSSHMTNIVGILQEVGPSSLVLLDELGAGTDPTEGAALAQAIMEHLLARGAKTIATTHYSELKAFAYSHDRVENASVEFDVETLRPTYRLLIGRPGRSNAFEISLRLGLREDVVKRSRSLLSQEERDVADLIEHLEANQVTAEREREEAERLRREAEELRRKLEQREQAFREKEAAILEKAREEAYAIVRKAREESDRIVRSLREIMNRAPVKEEMARAESERQRLREIQNKLGEEREHQEGGAGPLALKSVKVGQTVFVPRLNQKGTVLTLPNPQGELQIQAGILKLNVKLAELQGTKEDKPKIGQTEYAAMARGKAREMSRELDFRGTTADEAIELVEKYLDDAYLAGLDSVCLIHGKGTGALRAAIRSYLQKHRYVKSFRSGEHGEGGVGVTVVELKG